MQIQINGEEREFSQTAISLTELIETLALGSQRVAVELNRAIVPRAAWDRTIVKDGDRIEIVHFVGGGGQDAATAGAANEFLDNDCQV